MKFFDVEPRSEQWRELRLGAATSSNFHRVMTTKSMQLSKQAPKYMAELISEWLSGEEIEGYESQWMQRGQEVETQIWTAYEGYSDVETNRGGYYCTEDHLIGASPDRSVGDDGLVECKAPMLHTQVLYGLAGGPDEDYLCQLQGQLWISEREWCDVFSWHPKLFIPPIRVHRDEKFIAALSTTLTAFVETMLTARALLESKYGPFIREQPRPADDPGALGISDEDVEAILLAQEQHR